MHILLYLYRFIYSFKISILCILYNLKITKIVVKCGLSKLCAQKIEYFDQH